MQNSPPKGQGSWGVYPSTPVNHWLVVAPKFTPRYSGLPSVWADQAPGQTIALGRVTGAFGRKLLVLKGTMSAAGVWMQIRINSFGCAVSHSVLMGCSSYCLGCVHIEKADIYFLIDGSGSINQEDFLEMKAFMKGVINEFHIGPDRVRFGVVQYSDGINSQIILSQYSSAARMKVAIDGIQQRGGGTMTGRALSNMAQVFADTARSNVPWYLLVITDGKSADPVAEAAEALRGDGVIIYAIGVRDANTIQLKEIAKDKMFFVHEFDSLKSIQQEVVRDVCSSESKNFFL